LNADGSPAAGLYVEGRELDKNGFFRGRLKNNSDYVEIYKTKKILNLIMMVIEPKSPLPTLLLIE